MSSTNPNPKSNSNSDSDSNPNPSLLRCRSVNLESRVTNPNPNPNPNLESRVNHQPLKLPRHPTGPVCPYKAMTNQPSIILSRQVSHVHLADVGSERQLRDTLHEYYAPSPEIPAARRDGGDVGSSLLLVQCDPMTCPSHVLTQSMLLMRAVSLEHSGTSHGARYRVHGRRGAGGDTR